MDQELKQEFEKIDKRFDGVVTFLQKNMVTREEFSELKLEVGDVKESVSKLITAVDGLTKLIKDMMEEHTSMKHQLLVMQDWMKKAGEKVGIEFKL